MMKKIAERLQCGDPSCQYHVEDMCWRCGLARFILILRQIFVNIGGVHGKKHERYTKH